MSDSYSYTRRQTLRRAATLPRQNVDAGWLEVVLFEAGARKVRTGHYRLNGKQGEVYQFADSEDRYEIQRDVYYQIDHARDFQIEGYWAAYWGGR